jgi:hypothetical protein
MASLDHSFLPWADVTCMDASNLGVVLAPRLLQACTSQAPPPTGSKAAKKIRVRTQKALDLSVCCSHILSFLFKHGLVSLNPFLKRLHPHQYRCLLCRCQLSVTRKRDAAYKRFRELCPEDHVWLSTIQLQVPVSLSLAAKPLITRVDI